MIADWIGLAPVFLIALLITLLPGALVFGGLGVRGLAQWAAAPLFSVLATAALGIVYGAAGIDWSLRSWGIGIAVLAAVGWGIARVLRIQSQPVEQAPRRWLLPAAIGLGILFTLWRFIAYIQVPSGVSQTNDAVFHMNAVRYILETANASSLHVNAVIGGRSFYPSAWHDITSIVVMVTGADVASAANAFTLVIAAVIWTLGITWLTRTVTSSATVAAYAAVIAGALHTFPLLMFQWGVLFPNALSTAMIPAGVALVISSAHWSRAGEPWRTVLRSAVLVIVPLGALALSQPAALLPWGAISLVWLSALLITSAERLGRIRAVCIGVFAWAVLGVCWLYLNAGTSGSHWPPFRRKVDALVDVLLNAQVLIPPAFEISLLMLIGLAVAIWTKALRWFAVAWCGISALYVLVAGFRSDLVREHLLGGWYADPYRIAALAPIVVIPLAAVGMEILVRTLATRVSLRSDLAPTLVGVAALGITMVLIILLRPVAMPAFLTATYDRESRYLPADDAFLNPDERTMLESLDELVPEGERVIANPSTGAGFGYFLSGVDVYPRTWAPPTTDAWNVLAWHLRDVADKPAVCEALSAYDAEYVLDFGEGEEDSGRYLLPGMTDFVGQDGFELVAEVGDTSLWRITACAQ